jgi:uncharacterized protein (TIGR02246 family)
MTPTGGRATEESRIRRIIESWAEAVRNRDSSALTANFAPDAMVFDLIEPLRYSGPEALRGRVQQWLSSFQGPTGYEVRDLKIMAGDDLAFCHSLNRVIGTATEGKKIDMWWRSTVCFRKVDGNWIVVHEHSSVPFHMKNGRAALRLKP